MVTLRFYKRLPFSRIKQHGEQLHTVSSICGSHKHIPTSQSMRMFYKFLTEVNNISTLFNLKDLSRSHKHINRCFARYIEVKNKSTLFCNILTEVRNTSPDVLQDLQKSQTHHPMFCKIYRSHKHIDVVLQDLNRISHKHITRCFARSTEVTNTWTMFCKILAEVTNTSPLLCKVYKSHKHITDVFQDLQKSQTHHRDKQGVDRPNTISTSRDVVVHFALTSMSFEALYISLSIA